MTPKTQIPKAKYSTSLQNHHCHDRLATLTTPLAARSHDQDGDNDWDDNNPIQPAIMQSSLHEAAAFLTDLHFVVVIAGLYRRWEWAYPPLRNRGEDGRYRCVAEDGAAV
jgi:hypothetical protein